MSRPGECGKKEALSIRVVTPDAQANGPGTGARPRSPPWTVTQEFFHDGYWYRLSRRPIPAGGEIRLTPREDEAVSHLKEGLSNREIARRLGVAPSTVGVLLFRASAKFHVTTRHQLIEAYASLVATRRVSNEAPSFTGDA
jgi:DNA-binding CsgD family transcriptional regulator